MTARRVSFLVLPTFVLCAAVGAKLIDGATPRPARPAVAMRTARDVPEAFAAALRESDPAAAAVLFAPPLRESLSETKFAQLWTDLTRDAGRMLRVRARGRDPFGSVEFWQVEARFTETELNFRLLLDGQRRITGLEVTSDDPPAGIPKEGLRFGDVETRLAAAIGTLTAKIVETDGSPVAKASFLLWRAVETAAPGESVWNDPATGRAWRQIAGFSSDGEDAFEHLDPGTYRVTAVGRHSASIPYGFGVPVVIDADHPDATTEIRLARGGDLVVYAVDAKTGKPIPTPNVTVTPVGEHLPPGWFTSPSEVPGQPGLMRLERLPQGRYVVRASYRPGHPDESTYDLAGGLSEIEITEGREQSLELRFEQRSQTEEEIVNRWPFLVTGRVTDEQGKGIPDAVVRVHSGLGTLFQTGAAVTDEDGSYRLRFAPGAYFESGAVAASISASKPGMFEKNLNRQGNLRAAYELPKEPNAWSNEENTLLPGKRRELNFVLSHAATLSIDVAGASDKDPAFAKARVSLQGREMPPSSSVVDTESLSSWGDAEFSTVPRGYEWFVTLEMGDRKAGNRRSFKSQPFRLEHPQRYRLGLKLLKDPSGLDVLAVTGLSDSLNRDVTLDLVGDDPLTHPPAPPAEQEKAREILREIGEANRDWLGPPAPEIGEYSYEFRFRNGGSRRYSVGKDREESPWVQHGIAYTPPLASLVADPENAVFRLVEFADDRIRFSYTLRKPVQIAAGNGVLGSYGGFFNGPVREGILVIDPKTLTVVEHQVGDTIERYADYMAIGSGRYAPRTVEIQGSHHHHWKFRLYEPGLWLFSHEQPPAGETEPAVSIHDIRIAGHPARELILDAPPK